MTKATTKLSRAELALTQARACWEQAKTATAAAAYSVNAARRAYAAVRPLKETEKRKLIARVAAGQPLCCTAGLAWLKENLPEPWALAINEWAYSELGCHTHNPDDIARYMEKISNLSLHALPYDEET